MAASDLKTMTKQSLEKNRIFFDEAISKIEDEVLRQPLRWFLRRSSAQADRSVYLRTPTVKENYCRSRDIHRPLVTETLLRVSGPKS